MSDALIFTTRAATEALSDAVDKALGEGRARTAADLVANGGDVSYSGGGRHVSVEELAAKPWARVRRNGAGDRWAYPWSSRLDGLRGRVVEVVDGAGPATVDVTIPDGPDGAIDDSWGEVRP